MSQVALLVPHLRPVIQLCLDISGDKNLGETVRVKAITFLGYITRLKKKVRKKVDYSKLVWCTGYDEVSPGTFRKKNNKYYQIK